MPAKPLRSKEQKSESTNELLDESMNRRLIARPTQPLRVGVAAWDLHHAETGIPGDSVDSVLLHMNGQCRVFKPRSLHVVET